MCENAGLRHCAQAFSVNMWQVCCNMFAYDTARFHVDDDVANSVRWPIGCCDRRDQRRPIGSATLIKLLFDFSNDFASPSQAKCSDSGSVPAKLDRLNVCALNARRAGSTCGEVGVGWGEGGCGVWVFVSGTNTRAQTRIRNACVVV